MLRYRTVSAVGYMVLGCQYRFGSSMILCRCYREHDWHYLVNEMQVECPYRPTVSVTSEQKCKRPRGEAEDVSQPRTRKCTPQDTTKRNVQTACDHPCPGMAVACAISRASLGYCKIISIIYRYTTGRESGLSQPLLTYPCLRVLRRHARRY